MVVCFEVYFVLPVHLRELNVMGNLLSILIFGGQCSLGQIHGLYWTAFFLNHKIEFY